MYNKENILIKSDFQEIKNPYKISDFFFWENDGEKEATYHKDFVKYFYTWKWYQAKLEELKYWLVLWRKWTGKSILWWYFHKKLKENSNKFSKVISYRDFKYNLLLDLEDNDIKPNQYISIWKFILFIYLGKLLLENESLKTSDYYIELESFISSNFSLDINQNKILEIAINKSVKWELCWFWWKWIHDVKYEKWSYLNYLDKLEENILWLIKNSSADYNLILDDLDDRFRRNIDNKDALISLIKTVNYINLSLAKQWLNSKIITLLRTDIFSYLNDPDLNKIRSDNWIIINWWNTVNKHSELFKMLIHKVRESKNDFKKHSYTDLYNMLFPQWIWNISPEKFFLERTFFRPRDIIAYIKVIVDKYNDTKYIWYKAFQDWEREYSNYLLSEIENELIWHFDDIYIKEGFTLLKQFKKNKFSFIDINKYFLDNKSRFPNIDVEKILNIFFEFGILWNSWKNGDKNFYSTIIRDERAEIDFDKDFVLHLWLRKAILY